MAKDDGALSATAYLLSQESMLQDLEGFSFGAYKTFQITVRKVEELTGLDFGDLKDADPLKRARGRRDRGTPRGEADRESPKRPRSEVCRKFVVATSPVRCGVLGNRGGATL